MFYSLFLFSYSSRSSHVLFREFLDYLMAKKTWYVFVYALLLSFVVCASAVRVGVVVGSSMECVDAVNGSSGYDVLQSADLSMAWSYFPLLGHALCSINYVGCPASNCFCNSTSYWNFYSRGENDSAWVYSAVGFDGGFSCADHYCAKDGDLLGFGYGPYGTVPQDYSFGVVCCSAPGDVAPCGDVTLKEVTDYIVLWSQGEANLSDLIDLIILWQQQE